MRPILVAIIALALIFNYSCSNNATNDEDPSGIDPARLIDIALKEMVALDSYESEFAFWPQGDRIAFAVSYAEPDSYHERMLGRESGSGTEEIILLGDKAYGRYCKAHPNDCEEWKSADREDRLPPNAFSFTTLMPETLGLVFVDVAENLEVATVEGRDPNRIVHLTGEVNVIRASYENHRRLFGDDLIDEEDELTVDEYYRQMYGDLEFADAPPATIDIWTGASDRIHKVTVSIQEKDEPYFEVEYSRFDDVTIEPPI